jgi:hypothetical protein
MLKNISLGIALLLGVGAGVAPAQPSMWRQRPQQNPQQTQSRYERWATDWVRLYLRRNPTQNELLLLVNQLRNGANPLSVQANILASDEYIRRSGNSQIAWANSMVADTLGRPATPQDRALVLDLIFNYGFHTAALLTLQSRTATGVGTPPLWFWWF